MIDTWKVSTENSLILSRVNVKRLFNIISSQLKVVYKKDVDDSTNKKRGNNKTITQFNVTD